MRRGRIMGVKKTTILLVSMILNITLGVSFILFSIFYLKNYYLWFFIFSTFAGLHSVVKSMLFRLDSACYLGFLLLFLGIGGFCAYFFNLDFKYFYLLSATGLASLLTFMFTKQKFHFFFGVLCLVSALLSFLFALKIINLAVFLSIYLIFLFLFGVLCAILFSRYLKS